MLQALLFILFFATTLTSGAMEKINSLSGSDVLTGEMRHFKVAEPKRGSVILFLSAKCPCSASHEPLLKELSQTYQDFQFIGIHANADETASEAETHFREVKLPFPVIRDSRSQWANKFGALKTPHAYVLSAHGELLYQGGVTDSHVGPTAKKHFLKEVLEDLQANKASRHKEGRALGCYIQRAEET